jgi:glycosyltransferase involved in cell wall biosynthesis
MKEGTRGVFAPYAFHTGWANQQLLKDCGLVPYMFHKIYGYDATMVSVRNGEYPYLEQYLHGMKMDFLPDCPTDVDLFTHQIQYLNERYREMDVLVLYGPYPLNQYFLQEYRKLRPDGKVYLGLDANSGWMDRIQWTRLEFAGLLDSCDVIATSGRKMQRHLSRKWTRWKIEYIPNGFFNPTGRDIIVSPEEKENILLTVGRIGTQQKANHILLEAFARVSEALPTWRVHLAGGIDAGFEDYMRDYFQRYPALEDRVIFKGLLESKEALYAEYRRAKIFILTSTFEGGTPNVFAEAAFHGCYMITSDIDAADDITNSGEIGKTVPIGDVGALAHTLLEVCADESLLSAKLKDVRAYAKNVFDWELIVKRLHHLLFEV